MKCPHCGAKNPDSGVFCTQCNQWILPQVSKSKVSPFARVKKPAPKAAAKWKIILTTIAITCAVMAGINLLLPALKNPGATEPGLQATTPPITPSTRPDATAPSHPAIATPDTQWILCQDTVAATEQDGMIAFLYNKYFLPTSYPIGKDAGQVSLDGKSMAILAEDQTLLYLNNGEYTQISSDVVRYQLSAEGNAVVYMTDHSLRLYRLGEEDQLILSFAPNSPVEQFVISPDGETVCYTYPDAFDKGKTSLYQCRLSEPNLSYSIASDFDGYTLLAASNGSDMVYACDQYYLYTFTSDKEKYDLGLFQRFLMYPSSKSGTSFYLSADHRQILFFHQSSTYFSADGKTKTEIGEDILSFITPQQTASIQTSDLVVTLPTQELRGKLLRQPQYSLVESESGITIYWISYNVLLLQEDLSTQILLEKTQKMWLGQDDELFFLSEDGLVMRMEGVDSTQLEVLCRANSEHVAVDAIGDNVYCYKNHHLQLVRAINKGQAQVFNLSWPDPTSGSTVQVSSNGCPYLLGERIISVFSQSSPVNRPYDLLIKAANGNIYIRSLDYWYLLDYDAFGGAFRLLRNQ